MSDQRTLLQRLHDDPPAASGGDDAVMLAKSVLSNLNQALGTTVGGSVLDPEYGFPAMSDLAIGMPTRPADDPDLPLLRDLKRHLRRLIERYEPRLVVDPDGISVVVDRRAPLVLGFQVRGRLVVDGARGLDYACVASLSRQGQWEVAGAGP